MLIVMLLVALLAFVISKQFSKPLANLSKVMTKVAGGDLCEHAVIRTKDEIGDLARKCQRDDQ